MSYHPEKILVTGGAGFIGANFVRSWLQNHPESLIVVLDALTYAGNRANLPAVETEGDFRFVHGDIRDYALVLGLLQEEEIDTLVHFAAESHVDRSIHGPDEFIDTNVIGTHVLLKAAKAVWLEGPQPPRPHRFHHVSTDEVYGTLPEDKPEIKFTEETPLQPNSPYSASKCAGDCLVRSYFHTFHMPVLTTRCSNNYGPYHFPEKLIPLFVTNLMEGKKVPLYGDGLNIRDWLYVEDHCDAIWAVLNNGRFGEVYNVGGNNEITNRVITETLIREMGQNWDDVVTYVKDRPGHDRRYAIDATKIKRELGWEPKYRFDQAIKTTVQWYKDNQAWWRSIKSGEYLKYYEQQYAERQ